MKTADQNRQAMPQVAAFVDAMRKEFGVVRVTYACENGTERGVSWDRVDEPPNEQV
jgi:hypothetical protein